VVGLGNPGPEYSSTRHNLGAMVVERCAARLGTSLSRKRWSSLVGFSDLSDGRRVWLVRPQTYMNESGRAVRAAVRDVRAELGFVWVVYDEMDLPLCRLRIRVGGSAAGHNGVRSIIGSLGSDAFLRFRFGVGKPPSSAAGARHVLGGFSRREAELVPRVVEGGADAVLLALSSGLERAMDLYNRSGSLGCPEVP
jgi:PTH1 family peptidyl-tRNA hydrolase